MKYYYIGTYEPGTSPGTSADWFSDINSAYQQFYNDFSVSSAETEASIVFTKDYYQSGQIKIAPNQSQSWKDFPQYCTSLDFVSDLYLDGSDNRRIVGFSGPNGSNPEDKVAVYISPSIDAEINFKGLDIVCSDAYDSVLYTFNEGIETSGTYTDTRDNKTYQWKRYGDLEWMLEDIQYESEAVDHDYYGCLYEGTRLSNVAPDGWRVSTKGDWENLVQYVQDLGYDYKDVGRVLGKVNGKWRYSNPAPWDSIGFGFVPTGGRYTTSDGVCDAGRLWTATTRGSNYMPVIHPASTSSYDMELRSDNEPWAVRCCRDAAIQTDVSVNTENSIFHFGLNMIDQIIILDENAEVELEVDDVEARISHNEDIELDENPSLEINPKDINVEYSQSSVNELRYNWIIYVNPLAVSVESNNNISLDENAEVEIVVNDVESFAMEDYDAFFDGGVIHIGPLDPEAGAISNVNINIEENSIVEVSADDVEVKAERGEIIETGENPVIIVEPLTPKADCQDANRPIVNDRLIDFVDYAPQALDEFEVRKFMNVLQGLKNGTLVCPCAEEEIDEDGNTKTVISEPKQQYLYTHKINTFDTPVSVLKKIELLETMRNPDLIEYDFINDYSDNSGFNIDFFRSFNKNGNTNTTSENSENDTYDEANTARYLRNVLYEIPNIYKEKSTHKIISSVLYCFGISCDIIPLYTIKGDTDYENFIETPEDYRDLDRTDYPTSHCYIRINLTKTRFDWYEYEKLIKNMVNSYRPINVVIDGFLITYDTINVPDAWLFYKGIGEHKKAGYVPYFKATKERLKEVTETILNINGQEVVIEK